MLKTLALPVLSNQCGICHAHEQFAQQDQSNDQHSNYNCMGRKKIRKSNKKSGFLFRIYPFLSRVMWFEKKNHMNIYEFISILLVTIFPRRFQSGELN